MKHLPVAERVESFRKFVSDLNKVNIFITQVDPDALASAVALKAALQLVNPGIEVYIFYCDHIGHPMNRGLFSSFKLSDIILPIQSFDPDKCGDKVIFVDSSLCDDVRMPPGIKINPIGAIDHHIGCNIPKGEGKFILVEDGLGAAATIFVELLNGLEFKFENDEGHRIARLLAVGIHTDTGGLIRAQPRDREAFAKMANMVPSSQISELFQYPVPSSNFTNWRVALEHMQIKNARLVTYFGPVSVEELDMKAEIADKLIMMDGISFVLVWVIVGDTVYFSVRNTDSTRALSSWVTERLKVKCGEKLGDDGLSSGGGKIVLGNLLTSATRDEAIALVKKLIESAILE